MSIKLSDTQLLMLSAAAQREDRCIAAPPNPKGAASQKVAAKLVAMGLAKEVKAEQRSHVWRRAVSAFRVWTCRRVGPISGGPLESRLAVERKRAGWRHIDRQPAIVIGSPAFHTPQV